MTSSMGSLQNLVRWVRDRTSRKKQPRPIRDQIHNEALPADTGERTSTRSSLYGFPRAGGAREGIAKEQVCENALYSKSSREHRVPTQTNPGGRGIPPDVSTRVSPNRLYNDSPAHVYEEIPGSLVMTQLPLPLCPSESRSPQQKHVSSPTNRSNHQNQSQAQGTQAPHTKSRSSQRHHGPGLQINEETRNKLNISLNNLDFTEAKEVGPYLVVPIRRQKLSSGKQEVGLIRTKDLVDVIEDPDSPLSIQEPRQQIRSPDGKISSTDSMYHTESRHVVSAEIHHAMGDYSPSGALEESPLEYIHCKKCKRPHGIYNDDVMEHYDESDDNVFDEPDLIKDSQVKGQGHSEVTEDHEYSEDESEYGIREQIYSTTEELQNEIYVCSNCARKDYEDQDRAATRDPCQGCDNNTNSVENRLEPQPPNPSSYHGNDTVYSTTEPPVAKKQGKVPYWKRYVTMGNYRKKIISRRPPREPSRDETKRTTQALDIPSADISYSTVATRLSPNTQMLLDGKHYKTLPIDILTPVKPSGIKKPFGYDKLELSKAKTPSIKSQYTMTELQNPPAQKTESQSDLSLNPQTSGARFKCVVDAPSGGIKTRSASCSDILDDASGSRVTGHQQRMKVKSRTSSVTEDCEYISMAHGSSPRAVASILKPEPSPSGLALQKKRDKILKAISKSRSRENLIGGTTTSTGQGGNGGHQRQRSIPMTENDIYNCDAETKRKIHILTRNKLSSTWNGPRPPPKGIPTRHSTLPHSFSPTPLQQNGDDASTSGHQTGSEISSPWSKNSPVTRSSDSLLLPKHLSAKDFHTLNRNSGFPGPLYLKPGHPVGPLPVRLKDQILKRRRFASSSDCLLLSSTIAEEPSTSQESLGGAPPQCPRRRSLSYDANSPQADNLLLHQQTHKEQQTYTNAAAIARNQAAACSYKRKHNPILSDIMRLNNDRQTLMLV